MKIKNLPDRELKPGLPCDRRGYLPLFYRGLDISSHGLNVISDSNFYHKFNSSYQYVSRTEPKIQEFTVKIRYAHCFILSKKVNLSSG